MVVINGAIKNSEIYFPRR